MALQALCCLTTLFALPFVKAEEITLSDVIRLSQIVCVENRGRTPRQARTTNYTVGAVREDSYSNEWATKDMHEAMMQVAFKFGFSKILSMEARASYAYQHASGYTFHKDTVLTPSALSGRLILNIPEVRPNSTWCAYTLTFLALAHPSAAEALNFHFNDLIITDARISLKSGDLVIRGHKQRFDNPKGYLLASTAWPEHNLCMYSDGNICGWHGPGDSGPKGWWRLLENADGSYLLSTIEGGSERYAQAINHRNIRTWQGDPGIRGHFKLQAHPYKMCYLISTVRWPDKFMRMQNRSDHNVRLREGDPGDMGCWTLSPVLGSHAQIAEAVLV